MQQRVPHPLTAREAEVIEIIDISSTMRRIVLSSEQLQGLCFEALSPESHVKLFFPCENHDRIKMPGIDENGDATWSKEPREAYSPFRDYTIRRFDAQTKRLEIDFVKHDHGVGGAWAGRAQLGDVLGVLGPRSSKFQPLDMPSYVLMADETSLPAFCRWLEILPVSADIEAWIEVEEEASKQSLPPHPNAKINWLVRNGAAYGSLLASAPLASDKFKANTWVWGASEAQCIATLRTELAKSDVPREQLDLVIYWRLAEHRADEHKH